MSRTRGERRYNTQKQWVSKLKKLFRMPDWAWYDDYKTGERFVTPNTYKDLMKCKDALIIKNTNKWHRFETEHDDIKELHKRRVQNKSIPDYEMDEVELNSGENFERFCKDCDYFGTEECKHKEKAKYDTDWKRFGWNCFYD